jgi:hypothetical protein
MMVVVAWFSDRYRMRGPGVILGLCFQLLGFVMLIALDPSARNAKYAALVFCETGQLICLPLNV